MYAVIFKAKIKQLDKEYLAVAERMRELALNEYGCTEFVATTEDDTEVAISYWPSQQAIKAWRNNLEHQQAQQLGKERWYESYQVEVVEVLRSYKS